MERWIDVGAVDDFQDGAIRLVNVLNTEVGIAFTGGEFFAMRNVCPHTGAPVCLGRLRPLVTAGGTPWEVEVDMNRMVVICPWHFWEFDVSTGKAVAHPRMHLKMYRTATRAGRVLVNIGMAREEASSERTDLFGSGDTS